MVLAAQVGAGVGNGWRWWLVGAGLACLLSDKADLSTHFPAISFSMRDSGGNGAMNRRLVILVLSTGLAGSVPWAFGEPPGDSKAPAAKRALEAANDAGEDEKRRLRAAEQHVNRLAMHVADQATEIVKHVDRPLLAYGEPARRNSHGTLWAFGDTGRPVAFLELFQASESQAVWYQSVVRTGDRPVQLQSPDGQRWQPPRNVIARSDLDDPARPAKSGTARLRQLKSLARRFTAHEIWDPDNSRFELRLLVQPVYRYDDADHGIQDGAAFVFAYGANPEIIVLLEALGSTVDSALWHYSAFPTSSAKLHVEIDGREVWTRPRAPGVVGRATDDYWLFSSPLETAQPAGVEDSSTIAPRRGQGASR
jgi:hypothetical protein